MSEKGNKFSPFTVPQQEYMAVRDDTRRRYALFHTSTEGEITVEVYSVVGDGSPKELLDRLSLRL